MTLDECIRNRRSVREYLPDAVSEEALQEILEAGRLAPSARNRQNWMFTVVERESLKNELADAYYNPPMLRQAPLTLVVWAQESAVMSCGHDAAVVDCSIALSFMILKATELGLGTCWLGAFDAEKAKEVLMLPANSVVVAMTPLGHPAEETPPRPRKQLEELADIRK